MTQVAVLLAVAAALAVRSGPGTHRLDRMLGPAPGRARVFGSGSWTSAWIAGIAAGAGTCAFIGGGIGAAAGIGVAICLGRLPTASLAAERAGAVVATAAAPLALDLLAACLEAGESPARALSLVATCVDEPLSGDLSSVGRALDLGATAEQAWAITSLSSVPALRAAADRFVHAEESGAALAPALVAVAESERAKRRAARAIAAKRVGVLAVGPLGLCFLPAFVLVGVVPVVAGLFGQLSL
jgi:Flp pilus assembly protein TadB